MPSTSQLYRNLMRQLARRRADLHVSQLTLDELTGMASGYAAKIEAEVRVPSARLLVEVFQAVGMQLVAWPIPNWSPPRKIAERSAEARAARERRKTTGRRTALPEHMLVG